MNTDLILLEAFAGSHPLETAQTIEGFQEKEIAAILDEIPIDLLVEIVALLNKHKVASYLKLAKPTQTYALIEKLEMHAAELILRQCEEDLRNNILKNISSKRASALRQKLNFKAFTIGSLMNPLVFSFQKEQTVKEAITIVKQEKKRAKTIFPVINAEGNAEGIVKIQDLILAENKSLIESIMKTEIPKFSADMSIDTVVNFPGWYEYSSIPVIDRFDKLIGILNFETVYRHKIESGTEQKNLTAETAGLLGELYRLGLTGLVQSISK